MPENISFGSEPEFSLFTEIEALFEQNNRLKQILWIHYFVDVVICFAVLILWFPFPFSDSLFANEVLVPAVSTLCEYPPTIENNEASIENDFINLLADEGWGPV